MTKERERIPRSQGSHRIPVVSVSASPSWALSWRRWGWSALAGWFALCCLAAGWFASAGLESPVRMAFLIFSGLFFLFGALQYFYTLVDFSHAQKQAERERLYRPPPSKTRIAFFLVLGLSCTVGLVALWVWRNL